MSMTQEDLLELLRELVNANASELHLKVPARPLLRIDGRLVPIQRVALSPQSTHRMANLLLSLAGVEVALAHIHHKEVSFGHSGLGRFHATLYRQRGSIAMIIRRIALSAPTLDELGLKPEVEQLLTERGLILVCGSVKRADALAALVDRYNSVHRGFVVTLEDPLTHLHRDGTATICQRGVGADIPSLSEGLRSTHRQRPDLIVLGDIPDRETAEGVLRAAEDEALVIAAVAAPAAERASDWLVRHYASDRDNHCADRVRDLLRAVIHVPRTGSATVNDLRAV